MDAASFQSRLLSEMVDGLGILSIYVGHRLGLFGAMVDHDQPMTSEELANAMGYSERYVREWLSCCTVHGYIKYVGDDRFVVPPGHATVLADKDSPVYTAAHLCFLPGLAKVCKEDLLFKAFKTGGGVDYSEYGTDLLEAIGEGNRPMLIHELESWIKAMPRLYESLQKGGRIADIGAGLGYSSIEIAKLFPNVTVDMVEPDEKSVEKCKQLVNQLSPEVANRITMHCCLLEDANLPKSAFDLVMLIECVHDLPNPVDVLRSARNLLKPAGAGAVLVADEKVADTLVDMLPDSSNGLKPGTWEQNPENFLGRLNYSFSVLHCLPAVLAQPNSAAIGTVITQAKVKELAKEAGLSSVSVVHENDTFRIYELMP